MIIVHGQVVGTALEHPKCLARGEVDDAWDLVCLGGEQHIPGAKQVDRHDVGGTAVTVVGESRGVDDHLCAARGLGYRPGITNVASVGEVEAAHLVAGAFEWLDNERTEPAAMPSEKNDQAYWPSRRLRSSSPPRTRRSPRMPRPASLFTTVPVIALESRREARS